MFLRGFMVFYEHQRQGLAVLVVKVLVTEITGAPGPCHVMTIQKLFKNCSIQVW